MESLKLIGGGLGVLAVVAGLILMRRSQYVRLQKWTRLGNERNRKRMEQVATDTGVRPDESSLRTKETAPSCASCTSEDIGGSKTAALGYPEAPPVESASMQIQWPPLPPSPSKRPADPLQPFFEAHLLQHEGSVDHYYEDAAAFNCRSGYAAVADGVTISCRSDLLADSLTRNYVAGEFNLDNPNERDLWWKQCVREWMVTLTRLYPHMSSEEQDRYEKLGSAATIIAFRLLPPASYFLYGIGDCCAFWFLNGQLVGMEPELSVFNNSPQSLGTKSAAGAERLIVLSEGMLKGDLLVLASDAMSEYFITHKPWDHDSSFWELLESGDDRWFGTKAKEAKANKVLTDDDYTVLVLRFPPETAALIAKARFAEGEAPTAGSGTALESSESEARQS